MTDVSEKKGRRKIPKNPDGTMTLLEHIIELRNRMVKAAIIIVLGAIVGWILYPHLLDILKEPYCSLPKDKRYSGTGANECDLVFTGPLDGFMIRIKIGAIAGIIMTGPLWLYQIWAFITPGLKKNERKYTLTFIAASTVLFAMGMTLAYFTLHKGLHLLVSAAGEGTVALLAVDKYLSFVNMMLMIFGASFEVPLLVVMLNMVGILSYERLMKWQRAAIFCIFVFAAVVTPSGDPFTMCALAVPMVILFEGAVVIARFHDKRKAARVAADNFHDIPDDEASPLDRTPSNRDD